MGSMLRREDESVYDIGSIPAVPHMLLSSRRHFREVALEGSRPSRTYSSWNGEFGRMMWAYLVQVINKPRQIITLKVRHILRILSPMKYVVELIVKLG